MKANLFPLNVIAILAFLTACNYSETKPSKTPPVDGSLTENSKAAPPSDKLWLVAKLFQPKCGTCHSSSRSAAGFAFDDENGLAVAKAKGGIVAGSHQSSLISVVIMSGRMPMPGSPMPTEKEKNILNCWIDSGAGDLGNECWKKANPAGETTGGTADAGNGGSNPLPPTPPPVIEPGNDATDFVWVSEKIFKADCGSCHNSIRAAAGIKLDTPENIRTAMKTGIVAGDHMKSLLSQVIVSGRMPPTGVTPRPTVDQIKVLNCWIDAGALETGNACWKASGATDPVIIDPGNPVVNEDSFAFLNTKVLTPACVGCHNAGYAEKDVRLDSLSQILKPEAGPKLVVCGDPEKSDLYKVIKEDEMPYGSDPLTADLKKIVFNWIEKGCKE